MSIQEFVDHWIDRDIDAGGEVKSQSEFVRFMSEKLYDEFEPTLFDGEDFRRRLDRWVLNDPDLESGKKLLDFVTKIFFIGIEEFNTLYKAALNQVIIPWIVECENLLLDDIDGDVISKEIRSTWFCPISDSLRINSFLHVNGLSGSPFRPDWRSLKKFFDPCKTKEFIDSNSIKRIVLIEDFVGSGTQVSSVVSHLVNNFSEIRVLIVPLVVCESGAQALIRTTENAKNITISPVLVVPAAECAGVVGAEGEREHIALVREMSEKYKECLGLEYSVSEESTSLGMLGFKNTGGLVVLFSNSPNNSVAMIHQKSESWSPLFPRTDRG